MTNILCGVIVYGFSCTIWNQFALVSFSKSWNCTGQGRSYNFSFLKLILNWTRNCMITYTKLVCSKETGDNFNAFKVTWLKVYLQEITNRGRLNVQRLICLISTLLHDTLPFSIFQRSNWILRAVVFIF